MVSKEGYSSMKKTIFVLLIVAMLATLCVGLVGCNDTEGNEQTYQKVTIDKTAIVMDIGATETIKAKVLDQGAKVIWESSNPFICTVENGVVSALTTGQAVVSATVDNESVYCVVEVCAPQESSGVGYDLKLNKYNLALNEGEEFDVIATVNAENGSAITGKLTYTSSDQSVATVSDDGKIKAIGAGKVDILVKLEKDGEWVSRVIKVVVGDEYSVRITPFSQPLYIGEVATLNFEITKNGEVVSYNEANITVFTSDESVAKINEKSQNSAKVNGIRAGYITLTVLLNDVNVDATYEFPVLDKNAEPIDMSLPSEIKIFMGASVNVPVSGVSWGTLVYTFENDEFFVEEGKIFAPKHSAETTMTVKHLETKQTQTVKVKVIEFNSHITTAEEFMMLTAIEEGEEVYLDNDIDLSNQKWSTAVGVDAETPSAISAFLVEKLAVKLNGQGHKITIRYDHNFDNGVRIAGLFGTISLKGSIENTVIDFEAKYYGEQGVDSGKNDPLFAMRNCVITSKNAGVIKNNFVSAKFYADNFVKREVIIGYGKGTITNNVTVAEVYKGGEPQNVGAFTWENATKYSNNVYINKHLTSSSVTFFNTRTGFMDAWTNDTLNYKEEYTAWKVVDYELYLNARPSSSIEWKEYGIKIFPLSEILYEGSTVPFVYEVQQNQKAISYDESKVKVTSSDSTIATYNKTTGKINGHKKGTVTITVEVEELDLFASYDIVVADKNATQVEMVVAPTLKIIAGGARAVDISGVEWGTFNYSFVDKSFTFKEGKVYAPSEAKTTTLTISHVETGSTAQVEVSAVALTTIRTAEEFMLLDTMIEGQTGSFALGADVDLSDEEWSCGTGIVTETPAAKFAYLIETLRGTIDGKGYKLTVRYDHDLDDDVRIGGIFGKISTSGGIQNTVIDFVAKYYGAESNDKLSEAQTSVYAAMRHSALTTKSSGVIKNNFIKAYFYADNAVKREVVIGYGAGEIENNIADVKVYKNNVAQTKYGTFIWDYANRFTNNVLIASLRTDAPSNVTFFSTKSEFIKAWNDGTLTNKDSYTGWTVKDNKVYLTANQDREINW